MSIHRRRIDQSNRSLLHRPCISIGNRGMVSDRFDLGIESGKPIFAPVFNALSAARSIGLMADAEIPPEIRAFLLDYVHTYEQLETLLLLHGHGDQGWTPAAVSDALKISVDSAAEALEELKTRRLLDSGPSMYRLASHARGVVHSIARLYEENRLLVVRSMNANAIERVRTGALRAFAEAFVIGGKKKNG